MRRALLVVLILLPLWSCEPQTAPAERRSIASPAGSVSGHVLKIAPLIDPGKLETLTGKRAATPRLRKACHWLEMARRDGHDLAEIINQAHAATGHDSANREAEQSAALIRNVTILERLGCLDQEGMEKLRRGRAPTITKGPYAGQLATGDHIIPRSVAPELDNALFNLEFMPEKLNQSKGDKISERQIQLAGRWHGMGLLSDGGLRAVLETWKIQHPGE